MDWSFVFRITAATVDTAIFSTVDNYAVAFRVSFCVNRKDFHVRKIGLSEKVNVKWLIKEQGRNHDG